MRTSADYSSPHLLINHFPDILLSAKSYHLCRASLARAGARPSSRSQVTAHSGHRVPLKWCEPASSFPPEIQEIAPSASAEPPREVFQVAHPVECQVRHTPLRIPGCARFLTRRIRGLTGTHVPR